MTNVNDFDKCASYETIYANLNIFTRQYG